MNTREIGQPLNLDTNYIQDDREAEENAARWMRANGFDDAEVTPTGRDKGIDVKAGNAIAQVKWQIATTGGPDVQRLGGEGRRHPTKRMLFFTKSSFSRDAVDYANDVGMALFTYRADGAVTPFNDAARELVRPREQHGERVRAGEQHGERLSPWSVPRQPGSSEPDPFLLAQQRHQVAAVLPRSAGDPAPEMTMGRTTLVTIRRLVILICVAALLGAVANPDNWILAVPAVCTLGGLLTWWWFTRNGAARR